jgi:ectoine hydroxylase-related dioxygenase (phytanoyl-CoA dioxygenase family)
MYQGEGVMSGIAQTFSASKVVESRSLNRVGAQPFRAVVARLIHRAAGAIGGSDIDELSRTGLIVLQDFLPLDEFELLRDEATAFAQTGPPSRVVRDGGTCTSIWTLPPTEDDRFRQLERWCRDERVLDLARGAEHHWVRPNHALRTLEHLHIKNTDEHDGQTDLHIDAPFDTHKLWLYLDEVSPEHAPFVYVPGSHKLDWTRLRGEYLESIGENNRSRRVSAEEVRRRGLEVRSVTCTPNTLVLANTCGYHGRSRGALGATRRALHMMFRSNPFDLRRRFRLRSSSAR